MIQSFKRTKIIATVGPACSKYETLCALVEAGADIFRLNFSHGTHEDHEKVIQNIRKLNLEYGLNVTILQDLQGPKIRTGLIKDDGVEIKTGDSLVLTTQEHLIGDAQKISVSYPSLAQDVHPGEMILMDDGKLELKVVDTNGIDTINSEIVVGGMLKSRKGINLPFTKVSTPSLTDKDIADLKFGLSQNVDWIALSFVRHANDIHDLRARIEATGSNAKIISKIEKPEALDNIDAIIEASDAVMVARGDLGVEVYMEEVPMIQKSIVKKCNAASKPVIIATQMMESMITNPRPTRAETNDVANAVMDGADVVMLSAETAAGKYPIEAVTSMTKTIKTLEDADVIYHKYPGVDTNSDTFVNDQVVTSACRLAEEVKAKAIIGITQSGYTAFQIAKHRPKAQIFLFSADKQVLKQLNLVWGVRCFHYDKFSSTDETISDLKEILQKEGFVKKGDLLINTASMPINERQRTNMIKLTIV